MNNAANEIIAINQADVMRDFFAPASTDMIDSLVAQYRQARERISAVAAFVSAELSAGTIDYFLEGNRSEDRGRHSMSMSAKQLFNEEGAVAALNAAFWSKTLLMTDVYDAMPQARRDEWNKSMQEMTAPEYEESTVRATMTDLLNARSKFLAERVDGIFRNLSGEHVTNSPMGFGKRMIIGYMLSYSSIAYERAGLINDLRCVIAKFMGRDEPKYNASDRTLNSLRSNWGQWVTIDGGALRIRLYKKGTAHLEVHPDMAWRLNQILHFLYPMAIPSEFRTKPKKKAKEFQMMGRPLPFAVLELVASLKQAYQLKEQDNFRNPYRQVHIPNALQFDFSSYEQASKYVRAEADAVMESIGGVKSEEGWFQFDYNAQEVVDTIVASGCIPDQKAHQFYPTPAGLAARVIEMAEIGEAHTCLEPSAGTGGLADLMPKERTTCVEISPLHCAVLRGKGYKTIEADFSYWADLQFPNAEKFDRVVMNPPFSEGRAKLHVEHASSLVKSGGRLVAILPASMKGKNFLPGFECEWSDPIDNEFVGASVSVVILKAMAA